jgi:hypothetical protein
MSRRLLILCSILVCSTIVQAANRPIDMPLRFRAGSNIWSQRVFAADFNGDGKQDVLMAADTSVRFFAGQGNGFFAGPVITTTPGLVFGIAQFNADSIPDLYTATAAAPFAVMTGNGDGTFAPGAAAPAGSKATLVTSGQFNGDAFADLACANAAGSIVVYLGDGAGAFTAGPTTPITISGTYADLKAANFDGADRDDLFLLTDVQSLVAWNSGSGSFALQSLYTTKGQTSACGDINGDGVADVVALNSGYDQYGSAEALFGTAGTHNLTSVATWRTPPNERQGRVALAQLDAAGGLEILLGVRDLTVLSHDGTGFRPSQSYAVDRISMLAAGSFNGDGTTDVIAAYGEPNAAYSQWIDLFAVIPGNGNRTLRAEPSFVVDLLSAYGTSVHGVADVNADGRPDLLMSTTDSFAVAYGTSTGFASPVLTSVNHSSYRTLAGDFNGDGRTDLLNYYIGFQPFFLQANGTFTAGSLRTTNSEVILIADLTGDGRLDVLERNGSLHAGAANGTFAAPVSIGILLTSAYNINAVDLNHDGRLDLAFLQGPNDEMYTHLNNGNGTFGPAHKTYVNGIRGFADLNGDGYPEMLSVFLHRGNGDGSFSGRLTDLPFASLPGPLRAADFDGDGKMDVAVAGAIFYGSGQSDFFDGVAATPDAEELLSTADYDGNGSPDLWMRLKDRVLIARTRLAPTGTVPPSPVTITTGPNPSTYGNSFPVEVSVAADALIEARGGAIVRVSSEQPSIVVLDPSNKGSAGRFPDAGTYEFTATYSGDAYYGPATASTSHTVEKADPSVNVSANPEELEMGGSVSICSYAYGRDYGADPSGTMTVRKDGILVGTLPAGNRFCDERLQVPNLPAGTFTFTTEYSGDDNYNPGTGSDTVTVTKFHAPMTLTIPPAPLYDGQAVTITASFPEDPGITGTVAFTWNGHSFSASIVNGKAVWPATFGWGNSTMNASYGGSASYEPATASGNLVIYSSAMTSGPKIVVTGTYPVISYYAVNLRISPVYGATNYDIYATYDSQPFVKVGDTYASGGGAGYLTYLPNGYAAAFAAVARNSTQSSPMGPRAVTSAYVFTGNLVAGTSPAKALHFAQLQEAINSYRIVAGLTQTTVSPIAAGTAITAADLTALRNAIAEPRALLGRPVAFTDPAITPGLTRIRAIHVQELRDALR